MVGEGKGKLVVLVRPVEIKGTVVVKEVDKVEEEASDRVIVSNKVYAKGREAC